MSGDKLHAQPPMALADILSIHNTLLRQGEFGVWQRWMRGLAPPTAKAIAQWEESCAAKARAEAAAESAIARDVTNLVGQVPMQAMGYGR